MSLILLHTFAFATKVGGGGRPLPPYPGYVTV